MDIYKPIQKGVKRLGTPGPFDIPQWDEALLDKQIAADSLSNTLTKPPAPEPVLTLPSLGLGLAGSEDWVGASREAMVQRKAADAAKQAQIAATPAVVNNTGAAVASGGGGISAYGYKGRTGLDHLKGAAPFGFQTPMWQALSRANAAMKAAGLGTFGITDGFRSYAAQVDVKRRKPNLAATPGRSIHGLGLAADIKATRAQKEWLNKNGARFGLYAPIFKKEDWHFQLLPSHWNGAWGK